MAGGAGCLGILGSDDSAANAGPWSQKRGGPRNRSYRPQSDPGGDLETTFTWTHPDADDSSWGSAQLLYSSTVTDGGRLYCSVNGTIVPQDGDTTHVNDVVALDPESREILWTGDPTGIAGAGTVSPPAVADGVVVHCGRKPIALDASDGSELWTREITTRYEPPTIADGTVYLPAADGLHAVSLEDGQDVWTSDAGRGGPIPRAQPAVGDAVYASLDDELVSYDRDTGEERWRTRHDAFESQTTDGEPGLLGTPVLGTDAVFAAGSRRLRDHSDHGGLVAMGLEEGEQLWQFDFEAAFDRSIPREPEVENGWRRGTVEPTGIYGAPALAGDTLYAAGFLVGTPKLLAVDVDSGALQWDADLEAVANDVLVGGDVVIVYRADGIETYSRLDGSKLGTVSSDSLPGHSQMGAGAIVGDSVVLPSRDGLSGLWD